VHPGVRSLWNRSRASAGGISPTKANEGSVCAR